MSCEALPYHLYPVVLGLSGIGWLALILFPRRPWANLWFAGIALPILLCSLYTLMMAAYWFQEPQGQLTGFFSVDGLRGLFRNAGLLVAAFIDLTVLPLIIGAWMARKAVQLRISYVWLLPCFLLTIALPATGYVLFAVIVTIRGQWGDIALVESQPPGGTG